MYRGIRAVYFVICDFGFDISFGVCFLVSRRITIMYKEGNLGQACPLWTHLRRSLVILLHRVVLFCRMVPTYSPNYMVWFKQKKPYLLHCFVNFFGECWWVFIINEGSFIYFNDLFNLLNLLTLSFLWGLLLWGVIGAASDVLVTSTAAKPPESLAPQRIARAVPKAPTSQSASMSSDLTAPATPAKCMHRSFGYISIICDWSKGIFLSFVNFSLSWQWFIQKKKKSLSWQWFGVLDKWTNDMHLMFSCGLAPGDASKAFPFQFGSISPGFMNGMQVFLCSYIH